ncbi:hypothetical protein U9M48_033067 [Paspalum notatum var. saurae]|uniref:Uncharacterized protein n=1 Tax=Paspalum notatum var. saurae TaxID=547442 RepID=A0AAQ3X5Z1_PASNO
MLLAGSRDDDDKVVAADQTGRTLLYDTESQSVRTLCIPKMCCYAHAVDVCTHEPSKSASLCSLTGPKNTPISLAIEKNLCTSWTSPSISGTTPTTASMASSTSTMTGTATLSPPPYAHSYDTGMDADPAHVTSYALVGGSSIWISKNTLGTHSFDVATGLWTKAGDWALPFYGRAQYVPEHDLWFGLTCGYGEESSACASDLTQTPPGRSTYNGGSSRRLGGSASRPISCTLAAPSSAMPGSLRSGGRTSAASSLREC